MVNILSDLYKFIEGELTHIKELYEDRPKYIIEHYNNEQKNIQAYNGRQLLEMIQNADDACEKAENKKILIHLKENTLIIANKGEPFSKEGVESLMSSDLSPKKSQKNKIGHMGLGFRSILSWADKIIINSGGAKFSFSEKRAHSFLENLIIKNPDIQNKIKPYIDDKTKYPIAILRVPDLLENSDNFNENFDTTISIQLKESVLNDVQTQINYIINKETLVFLNNIEIIEIDSPETKSIYKKTTFKDKVTVIREDLLNSETKSKTWNIKKVGGLHKDKDYELAIAWNEDLDDAENVLYSYFKTEVQFPFPALIHGTFKLTPDRKQLENDTEGHNKFLTDELAKLLIDTSLEIAKKNKNVSYLPLKLLNIDYEKIDKKFIDKEVFNFKEKMLNKIKENKVFPTVNNEYISYSDQPVYYDYPISKFLIGNDVKDVMINCEDKVLIEFIKSITGYYYNLDGFIRIISNRITYIDKADSAKLFYYLLTYENYKNAIKAYDFKLAEHAKFLIDSENKLIPWNSSIFVRQDNSRFKLPKDKINIWFINSDLINLVLEEFKKEEFPEETLDSLINRLEPFNVKKYSFSEIAETLVLYYKGKHKQSAIKELHSYLFSLYKNEVKNNKNEPKSLEISVPVLSRGNKIKNADEVYFGKNYGSNLLERLYSYDKSKLLAPPEIIGFKNEKPEFLKKYFQWLGVAELPRYFLIGLPYGNEEYKEYKDHLLRNYDYKKPLIYGDNYSKEYYKNFNDLNQHLQPNIGKIQMGSFDEVKNILSNTKTEDIFEWINKDERLKKTLENDFEHASNALIELHLNGNRYDKPRLIRGSNIRSYTRWLFSKIAWLPVEGQTKKAPPDRCCTSKTITSEFSPFVEKPKINIPKIADKLHLSEDVIENYLNLVGVHKQISSFPMDVLYEMLLSLPDTDREGKAAKSIYREIIENFDKSRNLNESKLDTSHPKYIQFLREGKVFCQKGIEFGYFPLNEACYINTKNLGNNILKRFPLICVDKKKGPKKVKKFFGVEPLSVSFKILKSPSIHPLNDKFNENIEQFKAFVYALKLHQDEDHKIKNRLKSLKIKLIKKIEAEFIHNSQSEIFEMEQYEFISDKTAFYILIPDDIDDVDKLRKEITFYGSIAEIFTSQIAIEEYRSFIGHLYSIEEIDREPLLLHELQTDSNEILNKSKQELDIVDNDCLKFWRSFSIASKRKMQAEIKNEKELRAFLEKKLKLSGTQLEMFSAMETFSDLSDLSIQENFYELFVNHKVDFDTFKRHFSGFDFINLFKDRFEDYKNQYRNEFSFHLFNRLKNEPLEEKKKYFEIIENKYRSLEYEIADGFLSDIEQYFKKRVDNKFSITLQNQNNNFSVKDEINKNLSLNNELIIPDTIKEKKDFSVFLLFNEIDEIKRQIEINSRIKTPNTNRTSSNSDKIDIAGKAVEYQNYEELAQRLDDIFDDTEEKIKDSKTNSIEDIKSSKGKKSSPGGKSFTPDHSKNAESIGFIAEKRCYNKLCSIYGEENVRWVSENAYKADPIKFNTGKAGHGYDLELTENEKVRYIEIKGTENISQGISMSVNEIKTALKFPDKYDLLIVENPRSIKPGFRRIKAPFKFKKGQDLLTNENFNVATEQYKIRFNWKE